MRQAAAIQLKNICRECWVARTSYLGMPLPGPDAADPAAAPPPLLSAEDKAATRARLVECLLAEPDKSIRDLLAETVHSIGASPFVLRRCGWLLAAWPWRCFVWSALVLSAVGSGRRGGRGGRARVVRGGECDRR